MEILNGVVNIFHQKLYDYFWTNRIIWGIIYENPQLAHLLNERNSYVSFM